MHSLACAPRVRESLWGVCVRRGEALLSSAWTDVSNNCFGIQRYVFSLYLHNTSPTPPSLGNPRQLPGAHGAPEFLGLCKSSLSTSSAIK